MRPAARAGHKRRLAHILGAHGPVVSETPSALGACVSAVRSLLLALSVCLPGVAVAADDVGLLHFEPLRFYRAAARASDANVPTSDITELRFNAFGRDFALDLVPNARLAAMRDTLSLPPGTAAYRGKLAGRPGSWARIVLSATGPSGLIFDGETLFGVESGSDTLVASAAGAPVMFRLDDVYIAPGTMSCAAGSVTNGAQAFEAMMAEFTPLAAQGAALNLDIGAVADFEFSSIFGANTEAALLTRLNNVDGIFSEQVGVQVSVAAVDIFDAADDPFQATDASDLLDELATYRGATPAQDALGLTHLFTGRNLDGSTAGIAYLGTVCAQRAPWSSRSFAVGLTEGLRGTTLDSLVAAHEIGHNFGAPHDAESGSACESTSATFLMAPSINGSNRFSACSIEQMQPEIASASCLTPLPVANVAVSVAQATRNVFAGDAFDYAITVTSVGLETATNVNLAVTSAAGLNVLSATTVGPTCAIAANGADCSLGDLAAGVNRQVTLSLSASAVGTFALDVSVTADADTVASDDTAVASITAIPSVDLVLAGSATGAQLNTSRIISATLQNNGDFAATGVTLSATLTAGLRADQASAGGATCTIVGQAVTCDAPQLDAHTTLPLSVTVMALATGNQSLTFTTSANEAERVPGDNTATIDVSVTDAAASSGGGGSVSWWGILALLGALRLRRSARSAQNAGARRRR